MSNNCRIILDQDQTALRQLPTYLCTYLRTYLHTLPYLAKDWTINNCLVGTIHDNDDIIMMIIIYWTNQQLEKCLLLWEITFHAACLAGHLELTASCYKVLCERLFSKQAGTIELLHEKHWISRFVFTPCFLSFFFLVHHLAVQQQWL